MKIYSPAFEKLKITSPRGLRMVNHRLKFHRGYDLAPTEKYNPIVNPIKLYPTRAVKGVAIVKWRPDGFGNMVEVHRDDGTGLVLAHMYKVLVKNGARVGLETPLGILGTSGLSTGYHTHYEEFKSWKDGLAKYRILNTRWLTFIPRKEENEMIVLKTGKFKKKENKYFKVEVVADKLNVRKEASTNSKSVGIVHGEDVFWVNRVEDSEKVEGNSLWYKIRKKKKGKAIGWVSAAYVK